MEASSLPLFAASSSSSNRPSSSSSKRETVEGLASSAALALFCSRAARCQGASNSSSSSSSESSPKSSLSSLSSPVVCFWILRLFFKAAKAAAFLLFAPVASLSRIDSRFPAPANLRANSSSPSVSSGADFLDFLLEADLAVSFLRFLVSTTALPPAAALAFLASRMAFFISYCSLSFSKRSARMFSRSSSPSESNILRSASSLMRASMLFSSNSISSSSSSSSSLLISSSPKISSSSTIIFLRDAAARFGRPEGAGALAAAFLAGAFFLDLLDLASS
mmetsp:Transcript_36344/g.75622  ORF Transcript_36344/g.75622 Transcript_36344/m.75622 type:complete len:278 (-) Transcript_36344:952-1785(-)